MPLIDHRSVLNMQEELDAYRIAAPFAHTVDPVLVNEIRYSSASSQAVLGIEKGDILNVHWGTSHYQTSVLK